MGEAAIIFSLLKQVWPAMHIVQREQESGKARTNQTSNNRGGRDEVT